MKGHEHLLGEYGDAAAGTDLVVVAGLHGNEPAGLIALELVLADLEKRRPPAHGRLIALKGNTAALSQQKRWISQDLNRLWTDDQVKWTRSQKDATGLKEEYLEQFGLLQILDSLLATRPDRLALLDLHSTSSRSAPFSIVNHQPASRELARAFPAPLVFGLHDEIHGTMVSYFDSLGITAVGFEGGQHEADETIRAHTAVVWLALDATGILERQHNPALDGAGATLVRSSRELPQAHQVRYRHPVRPDDGFQMLPGLINFQTVHRNDLLAHDHNGDIRAPFSGRILMPLYQSQGSDGFFIVDSIEMPA